MVAIRFAGIKQGKRPPPEQSGQDQQSSTLQSVISGESAATAADPPPCFVSPFLPPPPSLQTPVEIMAVWGLQFGFLVSLLPAAPDLAEGKSQITNSTLFSCSMPCRPLLDRARPSHAMSGTCRR